MGNPTHLVSRQLRSWGPHLEHLLGKRLHRRWNRLSGIDDFSDPRGSPLRFLRINDDTVIWSAPVELFCEVASDIRDRSPFAHTLYFGYTNGTFGYLPAEQEFLAGGYEAMTSPFTASSAGHLEAAVNRHLREAHAAP